MVWPLSMKENLSTDLAHEWGETLNIQRSMEKKWMGEYRDKTISKLILIIPIDLSSKRTRNHFRYFLFFYIYIYIYFEISLLFEKLDNVCRMIKRDTRQGKPCVTYMYICIPKVTLYIPGLEGACDHIRPPPLPYSKRKPSKRPL